jgi:hypothetical protein
VGIAHPTTTRIRPNYCKIFQCEFNGIRPTAVPHNDYGRVFKAIILAITEHQTVHGHEISKQELLTEN